MPAPFTQAHFHKSSTLTVVPSVEMLGQASCTIVADPNHRIGRCCNAAVLRPVWYTVGSMHRLENAPHRSHDDTLASP